MAKLTEYALPAYRSNRRELPNLFSTVWSILVDAAADPEAKEVICVLDALMSVRKLSRSHSSRRSSNTTAN